MDAALLLLTYVAQGGDAKAFRATFADAKSGALPAGWVGAKTGKGQGSVWKVVEAADAPGGSKKALAQTAAGPRPLFNLCVAEKTRFQDLDLTVSFKAMAGKVDQGGGPVWRYQDADNYYIARMNPLEDNFRVYKVVAGERTQLGNSDVSAVEGKWHTIRVVHKGKRIQCYLNGKLHLDVADEEFPQAGAVGLWTKADAQTWFADLRVLEK
jgi:3-keto-disaccharide hydrolase